MRKILLLSTVFALSLTVFAQNDVDAKVATIDVDNISATNDVEATVVEKSDEIKDFISTHMERNSTDSQEALEQKTSTDTALQSSNLQGMSAINQTRAVTAQEAAHVASFSKLNGLAEMGCSFTTSQVSYGGSYTTYLRAKEENQKKREPVMANAAGTVGDNGIINAYIEQHDKALQWCSQSDDGGSRKNCAGGDGEHTNVAIAFRPNLGFSGPTSVDDAAQLEYIQDLMYLPELISLNPDLYLDPNTNMKNILVEADRLRMFASVGQAVMSEVIASRTPSIGGRALPKIRETLLHGDFLTAQEVDKIVPESGISLSGYHDAISLALMNANYMNQKICFKP